MVASLNQVESMNIPSSCACIPAMHRLAGTDYCCSAPVPFKAVFRPRSAAAENMICSLLAEEISDSG